MARRLNLPLAPVLAAHLCSLPGPLYTVLMGYKESPVDEARRRFTRCLLRFFGDFFAGHRGCVIRAIGGDVDLVLPVPSSTRPGRAPLEGVEGLAELVVSRVGGHWVPTVVQRAEGAVGHMRPNATAFVVGPAANRPPVGPGSSCSTTPMSVGRAPRVPPPPSDSPGPARC